MSLESDREARLRALGESADAWAAKRRAELERQASIAKQILRGRTGSERLARAGVRAATDRALEALTSFLLT